MALFIYQLKQAFDSLKKKPTFVFSIVSTLSITLGALLCVLTLAYVMIFKPLPYPDQDRLYSVTHQLMNQGEVDGNAFTYPNLLHLYENQDVFEQSALVYYDAAVITSLSSEPMKEISYVTPAWFGLLSIKMHKGRRFENTENYDTYQQVAIISYEMWQTEFSADENILNESITFSGKTFKIIGVIAKNNFDLQLSGSGAKTNVYVPWDFNPVGEHDRKAWGNDDNGLMFIAKLNKTIESTISPNQLSQQLTVLVNNNWQEHVADHSFFKGWSININALPLKSYIIAGSEKSVLLLLLGSLGLVIIAITNIANLLISRTAERSHQLAISAAIGASQKQLFGNVLAEITLLVLLSLTIAQLFALGGFNLLHYYLSDALPRINELSLNTFSLAATFVVLITLTLLFTHFCTRMINYKILNTTLQTSGKNSGIQVSKKIRNMLISSQIAVATTLIFINLVIYKDAVELTEQPLGYETENIYAVVLAASQSNHELLTAKMTEFKKALKNLPQVINVSQSMRPAIFGTFALTETETNQRFSIPGKDVDHHYFSLINQPFIEGDNFTETQIKDNANVMIINDVLAKRVVPNGSAIGIVFNNDVKVIGVVKSINIPGRLGDSPRFYSTSSPTRNMFLIKVQPNKSFTRDMLIHTLKSIDSQMSLFSFSSLSQNKENQLFTAKATSVTTMFLSIITFILSGLGLYGILKYSCQMRKFEIGTRMAIGAKRKDIITLIFLDNALAFAFGIMASIAILILIYFKFSQVVQQYLSIDIVVMFTFTVSVIIIVALSACYFPLKPIINKPVMRALR